MGKNKKTKKNKDQTPSIDAEKCPEPNNNSMSDMKKSKISNEMMDVSINTASTGTPSDLLDTNMEKQDNVKLKSESPEPADDVSDLKNKNSALKSNLKTLQKKHEEEKIRSKKLEEKNNDLQLELKMTRQEIEELKKQIAHLPKLNECFKVTPMEIETTLDNVCEQPVGNPSDENTRKEKECNLIQDNAQGAHTTEGQDSKMQTADWWEDSEISEPVAGCNITQENDQTKNDSWQKTTENDQTKNDGWRKVEGRPKSEAAGWNKSPAGESSNPQHDLRTTPQHSGSNERWHNRRGLNTGQNFSERRHPRAPEGNEGQNHGQRNVYAGGSNRPGYNGSRYPGPQRRKDKECNVIQDNTEGSNDGQPPTAPMENQWQRHSQSNVSDHGCNRLGNNDRGHPAPQRSEGSVRHRNNCADNLNHNAEYNHNRGGPKPCPSDEFKVVTEIDGDLFQAPPDNSLAHCVAEDMRMGSGIATTFRQMFKRVDELLDQRKSQGQVAVLEDKGRYIYYLVTKPLSNGKPTMDTLARSLVAMLQHVTEHNVKQIAMPRIGCGLDRLDWKKVKPLIDSIFSNTDVKITVYNYNEDESASNTKPTSNIWLMRSDTPVAHIERGTAILCLCTAVYSVDATLHFVDRKFRILPLYEKMDRKLGSILHISLKDYHIFLLIVKERNTSPLSFKALAESVREARKIIDKLKYYFVAFEAFYDEDDPLIMEKVITLMRLGLDTKQKKELWVCWPEGVSTKYNTRPSSAT